MLLASARYEYDPRVGVHPIDVLDADPSHASGILDILTPEILLGLAHFATTPPSLDALRDDLAAPSLPFIVAIDDHGVAGFARASPWKSREAYRWTCELGVYVRRDAHSRGIATRLYASLFPRLHAAGLRTLLAGIALPNPASIRLHERFGMTHVGTLPRVGFKHGRWIDVGYWHRSLEHPAHD